MSHHHAQFALEEPRNCGRGRRRVKAEPLRIAHMRSEHIALHRQLETACQCGGRDVPRAWLVVDCIAVSFPHWTSIRSLV